MFIVVNMNYFQSLKQKIRRKEKTYQKRTKNVPKKEPTIMNVVQCFQWGMRKKSEICRVAFAEG